MPGGVQQVWGLPQLGRGDGLVGGVNEKAGCFERFEVCFKQLCFREVAWKSRFCGQKRYVNFMKIQTFNVAGYPTFIHQKRYSNQHPRFNETFLLIASIFCDLEMELMNSNQIWERKLVGKSASSSKVEQTVDPWKREHLKKPDGLPTVSGLLVFGGEDQEAIFLSVRWLSGLMVAVYSCWCRATLLHQMWLSVCW